MDRGVAGEAGGGLVDLLRQVVAETPCEAGCARLLEVGCGDGEHLEALATFGEVVGVDTFAEAVERARAAYPGFDVQVADACSLPFENEFDVVFSEGAFSWTPDQVGVLTSVARALKAGGALVAQMGAEGDVARIQEGYAQALRAHSGDYSCQFCLPREESYQRLLGIMGFDVASMEVQQYLAPLPGGRDGLRRWACTHFAKSLALYRSSDRERVLEDFEQACACDLWDSERGVWLADRRTLRFVARKRTRSKS